MTTKTTEIELNTAAQDQALMEDLFAQLGDIELDITEHQAQEPLAKAIEIEEVVQTTSKIEDTLAADLNSLSTDDLDLSLQDTEVEVKVEKVKTKKASKKSKTAQDATVKEEVKSETSEDKAVESDPKTTQQRVTHYNSKKSEVLLDRLGGNQDMILLEASDIDLDSKTLKEKQENLLRILNNQPTIMGTRGQEETVQKKVAEKVIILFTYFKKGGALNKVMRIAFETILKDGYISTGKNGNLYTNLINAHYSDGTARAQSGQMLQMFPLLKIANKEGSKLIPNEQSLILAKMKAELSPAAE